MQTYNLFSVLLLYTRNDPEFSSVLYEINNRSATNLILTANETRHEMNKTYTFNDGINVYNIDMTVDIRH